MLENGLAAEAPGVPTCGKKCAVESVYGVAALKLDAQRAIAHDGKTHDRRPVRRYRHDIFEQVVVRERDARVKQVVANVEAHTRDVTPWKRARERVQRRHNLVKRRKDLDLDGLESARVEDVRDVHTPHSKTALAPRYATRIESQAPSNTAREVHKVKLKTHARGQCARRLKDVVGAMKAESQRADDV